MLVSMSSINKHCARKTKRLFRLVRKTLKVWWCYCVQSNTRAAAWKKSYSGHNMRLTESLSALHIPNTFLHRIMIFNDFTQSNMTLWTLIISVPSATQNAIVWVIYYELNKGWSWSAGVWLVMLINLIKTI